LGSASGKDGSSAHGILVRDLWPHPDNLIQAKSESTKDFKKRQNDAQKALKQMLKQAKREGKKIVWDSTLDDRTTDHCIAMHGKAYGDGWTSPPPAHYNCRSRLVLR